MSLHNLNTPNKQWNMYLNTLSSISGDNLTIKPYNGRNLLLEVSVNNNIFIKKGDASYNLSNLVTGDTSFSNVDVSNNLNPLTNNNGRLGTSNKVWGNAFIRDISATNISISGNMTISGTISNVIQIIPRLANDISSSLGNNTNIWQKAFINDLSGISRINGSTWPLTLSIGATGPTGPSGATGATGPLGELGVSINATLTDINNFRLTTTSRIYQNISGGINDLSWTSVNGYYGLAKDAYPSLNPLSVVTAVSNWTIRTIPSDVSRNDFWNSICWSPELELFVAVSSGSGVPNRCIMTSKDGITWSSQSSVNGVNLVGITWSPKLGMFVALGSEQNTSATFGGSLYSYNGYNWNPVTTRMRGTGGICWSPELEMFVASDEFNMTYSYNGTNYITGTGTVTFSMCWSPELKLFVGAGYGMTYSSNGINWNTSSSGFGFTGNSYSSYSVCWSPQVGKFVAVSGPYPIIYSYNGKDWIVAVPGVSGGGGAPHHLISVIWSAQLGLFIATGIWSIIHYSNDGIKWTQKYVDNFTCRRICWSPELGILVSVGNTSYNPNYPGFSIVLTSSLKGRPPTSYNVFDSSFNRIDENGKWDFSNINVTVLTAGGASVSSDDRLKHNEVVINNGLDVIDKLTPKFYKKTQVLLDASYNGDLSNYAWTLEAGLIAQELLKISDLSYVVSGGDYYEQTYKLITQTNTLSNSYYEPSANNYEVSNNLITQAYNVNYNSIFVYGLAAIKELHIKVKTQETSILDEQLNDLVSRIEALESNNNV